MPLWERVKTSSLFWRPPNEICHSPGCKVQHTMTISYYTLFIQCENNTNLCWWFAAAYSFLHLLFSPIFIIKCNVIYLWVFYFSSRSLTYTQARPNGNFVKHVPWKIINIGTRTTHVTLAPKSFGQLNSHFVLALCAFNALFLTDRYFWLKTNFARSNPKWTHKHTHALCTCSISFIIVLNTRNTYS